MKINLYFFLLLCYLFSPINYAPFFLIAIILYSIFNFKKFEKVALSTSLLLSVLAISSLFMILFEFQLGKEIVELYKWGTMCLTILFFDKKNSQVFIRAFSIFSFCSFLLLIVQQLIPDNEIVKSLALIYASEELIEANFTPGFVRSTGFNEGPGHVGVLLSFNLLVTHHYYKNYLISKGRKLTLNFFATLSMVMSAAKGSIPILFLLNKKQMLLFVIITFFLTIGFYSLDEIYTLSRLLNSASGEARVEIWSSLFHESSQHLLNIIFGNPRLGMYANISVFDSDWIYVFFTKGIFGLLILLLLITYFTQKLTSNSLDFSLYFIVLILIGFSNPAFTDIKFGVVYTNLILCLISMKKQFAK